MPASLAGPKPLSSGSGAGAGDDGQLLRLGVPASPSREGGHGSLGANIPNCNFLTDFGFSQAGVSAFAVRPEDRSGFTAGQGSSGCRDGGQFA